MARRPLAPARRQPAAARPEGPATAAAPDGAAPHATRARRVRAAAVAGATLLAVTTGAGLASPAAAATSASGPDGQQVTVSTSSGLDPAGDTVTVSGSGFDVSKGIYVALCVDNGAGQAPSPCIGGVDMEGAGGASAWISSNPPAYGEGLAVPFDESGGSGSFSVRLSVQAADAYTNCLEAPRGCVIGTRADHTRAGDRSADVRIPVTFATGGSAGGGAAADGDAAGAARGAGAGRGDLATTGVDVAAGAGAGVLLAVAGLLAVLRARRTTPTRPGA
jgi:hypothetical protein